MHDTSFNYQYCSVIKIPNALLRFDVVIMFGLDISRKKLPKA